MAPTHAALLRGINVGKAKRVAMADLRDIFDRLGYADVRTLLNSGNVVFTPAKGQSTALAARIEQAIVSRLGVGCRVMVLTAAELREVVEANPFRRVATDPSRYFIAVTPGPEHRHQLGPLTKREWSPERLAVGARVAYLWCPAGMLESRLPEAVGRALGQAVTIRNWGTISKLFALMTEPPHGG